LAEVAGDEVRYLLRHRRKAMPQTARTEIRATNFR
jgi:hypothetical protein